MTLADITSRLGFDSELAEDPRALRKAILQAINELGSADADETRDWHTQLITALLEVQSITASDNGAATSAVAKTSQELVAIPVETMSSMLRLIKNREQNQPVPDSAPEQKVEVQLRESRASSRIEATKDFRKSRTYPFAGLSGAIAVAWGAREPLGITDLQVPDNFYIIGAAAAIALAACGYWVVHRNQEHDERILDALYETEVQEAALAALADDEDFLFDKSAYVVALRHEVERGSLFYAIRGFRPRLGSTVNLLAALRDAATLGLDRFEAAGTLNKKQNGVSTVYEIPDEYRPSDVQPIVRLGRARRYSRRPMP
jgi:hypothetical protein